MSLELFFIRCTHVIYSSSIIKNIQDMCQTGLSILAIFYFHFGDTTKQDARNLLSSVLFQFCSQSDKFSQVLSSIYSSHGDGSREPSVDTLLDCLNTILALQGQAPLYIIVDALDECPNSSGVRTQRQEVLEILKELIELELPHVHFCVTSRPEIDIRRVFDPLSPYNVSLHNQAGQIKDLTEYVKSVVCSDATMQNWPAKVKQLVIDTLAKKGGGMYVIVVLTPSMLFSYDNFRFRWAYCQLETLRQCPLRYIPSTLDELPETLDETYERILRGIPKKMQKDAHRIFQWVMVSSRPLFVEELAEVFAINFDEEMCGIPVFEPSWRDANAETAVLSACSSLVAIVGEWPRGKTVQFSHFSVKEYLTSDRIANAEHVSRFHLRLKPAHTLLAKACLSVLLHLDYSIDKAGIKNFPLAEYAAHRWVEHAHFEDVSWYIRDGMDLLFDKDKPHFAAWVWLHNMDNESHIYHEDTAHPQQPDAVPLYYAALCGFGGLVLRLLAAHPQHLNVKGGVYGSPLNAASAKGHLHITLFLLDLGADVENRGIRDQTALYIASFRGHIDVVRSLIDRGADLNAICKDHIGLYDDEVKWTPLHVAIHNGHRHTAILLLECGADTETRGSRDQTALYMASSRGCVDTVRQLISHGADLNAECKDSHVYYGNVKWTPLHVAICKGTPPIARTLLEQGANSNATDNDWGATPLHVASAQRGDTEVELLLEYGANVDVRTKVASWTPLHKAAYYLNLEVVVTLLNHGADPHAQTGDGETPIQLAEDPDPWGEKEDSPDHMQIIRLLSERTGERMWGLRSWD
jgi:ankyrin repeat protein